MNSRSQKSVRKGYPGEAMGLLGQKMKQTYFWSVFKQTKLP